MARRITKKDIVDEIVRCGKDPVYFINQYARIQHPTKGLVPFKTYHYQNDVINAFLNNRFNVVLKARQLGLTTITAAYVAWFMIFHRDRNVLVVATKQDTAKNTIRMVRNVLQYLPKWLRDFAALDVNNRHSLELRNGSRVKAVATSPDVGRSEALSLMVVDEVAHIDGFHEIWTGLGPTITRGGQAILLSTPNGTANFFHDCYTKAKNNENNFNCRFGTYVNPENPEEVYDDRLMWWVHPEQDKEWFEKETRGKNRRDVAQEYLCNFNASGDTFIHHEDIARVEEESNSPIEPFNLNRDVWVWEKPVPGARYLMPCDVSRGDAADYSAFHVLRIDCHPVVQVAEYKGKIRPDQLGLLLMSVSQRYNNAIIAPENNSGWSGQAILKIEEAQYPFMHYTQRARPKLKGGSSADAYYAMGRNDYLPGYAVTSANRHPMLAKLEQYIRMGDIVIQSHRLVDELKTFIVTPANRPEAQRGYHDDLIMALAGGLWVREEAYMSTSYRSDSMTAAMLDGMSTSNSSIEKIDAFNYNGNPHDRSRVKEYVNQQNKMVMTSGDVIDINWLISSG